MSLPDHALVRKLSDHARELGEERYAKEGAKYLCACIRGEFGDLSRLAAEDLVEQAHAEWPDHERTAQRFIADHERELHEAAGDSLADLRAEECDRAYEDARDAA